MTVHFSVCVLRYISDVSPHRQAIRNFFHTLFLSLIDHIVCTVTCRQFPNLTFAPRKTCHEGSNLTLLSYHATATPIIHGHYRKCKYFFIFLTNQAKTLHLAALPPFFLLFHSNFLCAGKTSIIFCTTNLFVGTHTNVISPFRTINTIVLIGCGIAII